MLVLFDTNIILDILEKRLPFYDSSKSILERCVSGNVTGYIALHSISNIFYSKSVRNALQREDFSDFEDCLQDECAKQIRADYIVTRNTNDFSMSDIPAIIPDDLLKVLDNGK